MHNIQSALLATIIFIFPVISTKLPIVICDMLGSGGPYPSDWSCATALADPDIICRNHWTGLSCTNSSISALQLSGKDIRGTLPSSIGLLNSITKIDLTKNSFYSRLPTELFNLTNMKVLLLADNKFTGILPPNIGTLTSLVSMDLSHNVLQSTIPDAIGTLSNLAYLALSHNSFTSTIPTAIGSLINLSFMSLSANRLESSIPTTIGLMTDLAWLLLSNNVLTSTLPTAIGALINLSSLHLGYNKLTSIIPSNIGFLTKLTFLGLSSNVLTSFIPSEIGYLAKLVYADISFNSLSSSVPSSISYLTQLSFIALSYNKLTSSLPSAIGNMVSMKNLRLRHCKFTSSIPTSIGMLMKLTVLLISQNSLTSVIPTSLGNLVNLKSLKLSVNSLTSSLPSELGLMTQLLDLQLSFNRFNSSIPTAIGGLHNLVRLDLRSNKLTSSVPTAILVLSTLKYLYLQSNSLQSFIPASIANMSHAVEISLENNKLTGMFPVDACQLGSLQLLSLGNNSFPCVPWCQTDVLWNTPGVHIPRCVDDDDVALKVLDRILRISSALSRNVNRVFQTIQREYVLSTQPIECIQYASAFSYSIDIGPYGYSCPAPLLFCLDEACTRIIAQDIATGFTLPLIVNAALFCYKALSPFLETNSSACSAYSAMGVTMRITAYLRQGNTWVYEHSLLDNNTISEGSSSNRQRNTSVGSNVTSGLCQSSWYGVNCTGGQVTSLSLAGLGLEGSIPTVIGLLTGLTSLDLSGNLLSGTIPTSVAKLKKMDTLQLNNNYLRGEVPSAFHLMSKLYLVDLSSNSLSSTVPSFFGHMPGLWSLSLDSNVFEGEVPSDICRGVVSNELTVSLLRNPRLTCYQEACWGTQLTSDAIRQYFGPILKMCVPTSTPTVNPTSSPTFRTASPALQGVIVVQPLLTTQQIVIVSVICPVVIVAVMCYIIWHKRFSNKAVSQRAKKKLLRRLPIHMLLLNGLSNGKVASIEEVMDCIKSNIDTVHCCDGDGNTPLDIIVQGHVHRNVNLDTSHTHHLILQSLPAFIHDPNENQESPRKYTPQKRLSLFNRAHSGDMIHLHGIRPRRSSASIENIRKKIPSYGWCLAVQRDDDMFVSAVEKILSECRQHVRVLGDIQDDHNRKCKEIAGARIKDSIARKLYLAERFDVQEDPAVHKSATSRVFFATDHGDPKSKPILKKHEDSSVVISNKPEGEVLSENTKKTPRMSALKRLRNAAKKVIQMKATVNVLDKQNVVLKLMRHKDQFIREVTMRDQYNLDPTFVLPIITYYGDPDDENASDEEKERYLIFREDAFRKGYEEYPYCIVMEAGRFSLAHVINHEHVAGKDWHHIRNMVRSLCMALQHIHSQGVVHGDLKPPNILVVGTALKLIDLDASSNYFAGDLTGKKFSSAYIPPEMFILDDDSDEVRVRSESDVNGLIHAHPSQDMWALGCVFYLLCTGHTLVQCSTDDNLTGPDDFYKVYKWDSSMLTRKLHTVRDKLARNLLSFLLEKDPTKRPDATRVLSHPFLTGASPTRLQGEKADFDAFLSYRVASDSNIVEMIYDTLTAMGLKVWWDRRCLLPGQNWEEGFCKGLVSSAYFVCLLSRGAIKNEQNIKCNLEKLTKDSPCDNFLLEWRLALELKERGMISGVFPIMIGDLDSNTNQYGKYSRQGCHPKGPDTSVDSVEVKVREHLGREGLGSPYKDSVTVNELINTVSSNQGGYLVGDAVTAVNTLSMAIVDMAKPKTLITQASLNNAAKIVIEDSQKMRIEDQQVKIKQLSQVNTDLNERLLDQQHRLCEQDQRISELITALGALQTHPETNEAGTTQALSLSRTDTADISKPSTDVTQVFKFADDRERKPHFFRL